MNIQELSILRPNQEPETDPLTGYNAALEVQLLTTSGKLMKTIILFNSSDPWGDHPDHRDSVESVFRGAVGGIAYKQQDAFIFQMDRYVVKDCKVLPNSPGMPDFCPIMKQGNKHRSFIVYKSGAIEFND